MIAGSARGRRLRVPAGDVVRPTSDRVKEAVFSALDSRDRIAGASVLDLWAGSGALAIEALSRGADRAVMVERDAEAVAAVRANLDACGFARVSRVIGADVVSLLQGPAPPEGPFDLVVADPPYRGSEDTLGEVLVALGAKGWVAEEAMVVFECRSGAAPSVPEPWRVVWERSFGDTLVLFLTG